MTVFVDMYHPLLADTITSPKKVAEQAVDNYAARGWLLVDGGALPDPETPYYTKEALLSQIQGGAAPIGTALRAALVPKWKPNTAYGAGEFVLNPSGQIVSANTSFTSGASYSAANWTVTGGGSSTPQLTVASTTTTAGALVVNKHTPVDATGAAKTMTLPTGQAAGTQIIVEKVDATANAVTVSGNMRGSAGQTVNLVGQYEAMSFLADAAGSWHPGPSHKTKTWLDASYVKALTLDKQTPAAPTTLMTDSFTGTAGTALQGGHTTDQGGAWTGRQGTAFVLNGSGQASFAATTYTDPSIHTTDLAVSNYTVTMDLTPTTGGSPGLVVRYVSTTNFIYVSIDPSLKLLRIYRGSTYLAAVSMPEITVGVPVTVRVDCYGSDVTVWANGVERITVDDSQNITSKTIGLRGGKVTGTMTATPLWGPLTVTTYAGIRMNWPRFSKYASNPLIALGTAGAYDDTDCNNPNVCWDPVNNRWVLYYSGYHNGGTNNNQQKMCVAYSTTGPLGPYTKDVLNPVHDSYGADFNTENGGLVWLSSTNQWFHAYHAGSNQKRIGLGFSTDLHTWTRLGYLPTTAGTWDVGGQYDPFLRVREDGVTLECWYAGANAAGARSIGRMTSIDAGRTWITEPNPVLTNPGISAVASFAEPSVWVPPGREGQEMAIAVDLAPLAGGTDRVIALAVTSDNGATWRYRIVSRPSAATWESRQSFDSFMLFHEGRLYLFHSGSAASGLVLDIGIQIGVDVCEYDPRTFFVGTGPAPATGTAVSLT